MKTYTVLFAEDVPHYGYADIEADNDREALAKARAYWRDCDPRPTDDPDWSAGVCHRIVLIEDARGNSIAHDIALDDFHLRGGGEADRLLCEAARDLLAALEEAGRFPWPANAAITTDIEALRQVCLRYAEWWNGTARRAIAKAKGGAP